MPAIRLSGWRIVPFCRTNKQNIICGKFTVNLWSFVFTKKQVRLRTSIRVHPCHPYEDNQ